ncbi:MAG: 2-hydroxyglutaryl-CoA dehydratase, partial [bacterium]
MIYTLGLDVGSTYTKAVILDAEKNLVAREMEATGSKLNEVSGKVLESVTKKVGLKPADIS